MNKKIFEEGSTYILVGIIFLLITIDAVFPIVMYIMKILFMIIAGLFVIGGIASIIKSFRKQTNEN